AQNETLRAAAGDKWMISARAGGVNYVEGDVAVVRSNARSGRLLKGDMVEIGDRVSTGTSGKAEILMNPGSYIRLAGNSAF
ncbi:FecR family protein, partial [Escherichia coli]|nr:FecR family protein [Escherichia coli]